jgi:phage gp36-like protein
MPYATLQHLVERFGQQELLELTDEDGSGVIDEVRVGRALSDADAEINSYLAGRYTLPLAQSSDELVRLACDVARYRLYDNRATDQVKERYDGAIAKLRDIARGLASLGIDQASKPVAEAGSVKYIAPDRVFNANSLEGF